MSFASQAAASGGVAQQPRIWLAVTDPMGVPRGGGAIGAAGGWIGRSAGAEIRIEDAARAVSSQHARIEHEADGFVVIDQSLNGTDLNAERLVKGQRRRIAPGDTLRLCGWRIGLFAEDPATGSATGTPAVPAAAPARLPMPPDATLAGLPRFADAAPPPAPATPRPRLDLTLADLVGPSSPPPPAAPPPVAPLPVTLAPPDPVPLAHLDALLPDPVPEAPPPPEPAAAPAPLAPPLAPQPATPAEALLAAFWRGLGLAPARATPALLEELGRALHEAWAEAGRAAAPGPGPDDAAQPPARAGLRGLRSVLDAPEAPRFAEALRAALAEPSRREAVLRDAVDQAAARMAESLSARALESRLAASVRTTWSWQRRGALWRQFEALEGELREAAEGRFRKDLNERLRGETRRLTWDGPGAP